jgi:ABC-type dipeptide/oligopeptide/nickel transport system permease component
MRAALPGAFRRGAAQMVRTLPALWLVITVVFLLIHLVPGDPIVLMLGEGASAGDIAALRHSYGMDRPLGEQYFGYWRGLARGDLGQSLRMHDSVLHLILQRYPYTLALTAAAMLIGLLVAIPAGVQAARTRGRWPDRLLSFGSLLGLSLPNFALGPVLILVFSIGLGWLPVSGAGTGVAGFLPHLVLPAVTLGLGVASILTRMVRSAVMDELGQDYVRTARAKGLPESVIVYRHALRNALNPVLTVAGLQFGSLLAGAIVTETIFSWPGLGRLTLSAVANRDYALAQGCILAIGVTYVIVNFVTDSMYAFLDPRMRP